MQDRLPLAALDEKIMLPEEAARLVNPGMTLAASGFLTGYPKLTLLALVREAEDRERRGEEPLRLRFLSGASIGAEIESPLAQAGVFCERLPYQSDPDTRALANRGECAYVDMHLSHLPEYLRSGILGGVDILVVEAAGLTADGELILTTGVGATPLYARLAKKIIVEINRAQPLELLGFHDLYEVEERPGRGPIPLTHPGDRIGHATLPVDREKIAAIVFSNQPDHTRVLPEPDAEHRAIAENLLDFLRQEVKAGRLPRNLLPLQAGVGAIANAALYGLLDSEFEDLTVYTEVLQDAMLDLVDAGKVTVASGSALTFSPVRTKDFLANLDAYRGRFILRPQEISNHPEIIRRLGLIAVNTAVEIDIYGNVNSTHVGGSRVINGIGGSGDFCRNGFGIFVAKSTAKDGRISTVVPMVSHVDHTEHDVDVLVTERGVVDLRGLPPRERAPRIIEHLTHPRYQPFLRDYYERARLGGGHIPHDLDEVFTLHRNLNREGRMLPSLRMVPRNGD